MQTKIVAIGHGYWGKNVARNLHQLGVLHGICETYEPTQAVVKSLYPDVKLYTSLAEVWADAAVQGVAISTPAETHAPIALAAFENGKDVFVEKPLALTYVDGMAMVNAANAAKKVLMVGHLLEYHPAVLALESLIQNGDLGKVQYVYSNRLNLGKFRREENILWSFAPHDIAVVLRLIGQAPLEVIATGGAYIQPNIADTTVTNLQFDNGVRAHIFVSWLHPYKEQKLVVVGSNKMAIFDDREEEGKKLMVIDKGADWVDNQPVPRDGKGVAVAYPVTEPLKEELAHFVDCVANRKHPRTDGLNGLRVLQVLQAAQQSLQTGGTKVPLFQQPQSIQQL
jgi:predicted dehydrogenase